MGYRPQEIKPQMRIVKLLLTESRRYKDMWLRPYEMNVTHDTVSAVEDMVDMSLGMGTTSALTGLLGNTVPDILTPSAMVTGRADIIHGWDEKRFKFVLIAEIRRPNSRGTIINYVQGYTEYLGIARDALDENMRLYVNSVVKLNRIYDSVTGLTQTVPQETFNVVNDETHASKSNYDSLKLARPGDIAINVASLNEIDEDIVTMSNVGSINSHELVDKRSLLPSDHIATTLKTAVDSKIANGFLGSNGDVIDSAVGALTAPSIYNLDFFKAIYDVKGQGTDFTLGDLELLEPDLNKVTEVIVHSNIESYNIPAALLTDETADTYDASLESRLSVIVHTAVSSLLTTSILNSIVFEVDNYDGTPSGEVLDSGSYIDGIDRIMESNAFMSKFINKAWNSITGNNTTIVRVLVMGMVESDTTVIITLDGGAPITYRYPTFADNKYLSIIMNNDQLDVMTEDYKTLIDSTLGVVGNAMSRAVSSSGSGGNGRLTPINNGLQRIIT